MKRNNKELEGRFSVSIRQLIIFGFLFFSLLSIITALILLHIYNTQRSALNSILENRVHHELQTAKTGILSELKSVNSDLLYLASSSLLKDMWETNRMSTLEENFLLFSKEKKIYDQIRIIDETGMEIVRINYNSGISSIVTKNNLQNKAGRYYFDAAIALSQEEIFVSPLDLNIEHGRIEQPLKPMIRFATPVYDNLGRKRGIIVLNYLASSIMKHIRENTMLLNRDGFWLHGGEPENLWGFMYGNNHTLPNQFPTVWEKLSNVDTGQHNEDNMFFSYTSIFPLMDRSRSSTGSGDTTDSTVKAVDNERYFWKLVVKLPDPEQAVGIDLLRRSYLIIFSIFTAFYLFLSFTVLQIFFDRRKAIIIELENREQVLQNALSTVKKLSGLLPICASCKKIRDDKGYWNQIEVYIRDHSEVDFSHSVCPECARKLYPEIFKDKESD